MIVALTPSPAAAPVLAGLWAALAGGDLGTDAATRDLACKVRDRWPDLPAQVQAARRFHSAAARQAVDGGIRRVIFAQAGVPVVKDGAACSFPLHREAAQAAPAARFCYADPGGEAVLLTRALYGCGQVTAVQGSIRSPRAVTGAAGFGAPLHAVICRAALTWVPGGQAQAIIAAWADVIGPGGSLALSVAVGAGAWRLRGRARRAAPLRGGRAVMAGRGGTDGRRARCGAGADMAVRQARQQAAPADLRRHRPARVTPCCPRRQRARRPGA